MNHTRLLENCPPGTVFEFKSQFREHWQVLKPGVNLDGHISERKTLVRMVESPIVDFIDGQTLVEIIELPDIEP